MHAQKIEWPPRSSRVPRKKFFGPPRRRRYPGPARLGPSAATVGRAGRRNRRRCGWFWRCGRRRTGFAGWRGRRQGRGRRAGKGYGRRALRGSCVRGQRRRGTTVRAQAGGCVATASQPLLRPGPPLVVDETQRRIDARPSGHGPPHGRGALYASAGGGSQPSAFCTIGTLANAAALRPQK